MKFYLWCIIERRSFQVLKWVTTTDPTPTHTSAEIWVLVKEFVP